VDAGHLLQVDKANPSAAVELLDTFSGLLLQRPARHRDIIGRHMSGAAAPLSEELRDALAKVASFEDGDDEEGDDEDDE
jgi:hypothetical protein